MPIRWGGKRACRAPLGSIGEYEAVDLRLPGIFSRTYRQVLHSMLFIATINEGTDRPVQSDEIETAYAHT